MRFRCGGRLALTDVGLSRGYDGGMLGHTNRVSVLHVFERDTNGTALPPHVEYERHEHQPHAVTHASVEGVSFMAPIVGSRHHRRAVRSSNAPIHTTSRARHSNRPLSVAHPHLGALCFIPGPRRHCPCPLTRALVIHSRRGGYVSNRACRRPPCSRAYQTGPLPWVRLVN